MSTLTDDDIFNTPPGSDNAIETIETEQPTQVEQPSGPTEKEQPSQSPPVQADDEGKSGNIPSWRLKQEAESRRLAEDRYKFEQERAAHLQQQLQQIQAANKPQQQADPDVWMDPQAYAKAMQEREDGLRNQFAQQLRYQQANMSLQFAELRYGDDFRKYWAEFEGVLRDTSSPYHKECQDALNSIMASQNPGESFMAFVRRQQVLTETGGDIDAYKKKLIEELKKDPKFVEELINGQQNAEAAASAEQPPATTEIKHETRLPPSLSKVAGSRQPRELSDDEIFNTPPSRTR